MLCFVSVHAARGRSAGCDDGVTVTVWPLAYLSDVRPTGGLAYIQVRVLMCVCLSVCLSVSLSFTHSRVYSWYIIFN